LDINYGHGKLIFIEHMNDLFANEVSEHTILQILNHCLDYPDSEYVLQTKNPHRYMEFTQAIPCGTTCGTTIESNRVHGVMGNAPSPFNRIVGMKSIKDFGFSTFITIEPILKFDLDEFADMLEWANPSFVNIGADSKGCGLDEPTYDDIMALYERLCKANIEVRKKLNLDRLEGAAK